MTDPDPQRAGRGPGMRWTRPTSFGMALFAIVLAILAVRVGSGQDPALHARETASAPPVRRILVRRVEIRRVIHHLPPSVPLRPSQSVERLSGSTGQTLAPTVTRAS